MSMTSPVRREPHAAIPQFEPAARVALGVQAVRSSFFQSVLGLRQK